VWHEWGGSTLSEEKLSATISLGCKQVDHHLVKVRGFLNDVWILARLAVSRSFLSNQVTQKLGFLRFSFCVIWISFGWQTWAVFKLLKSSFLTEPRVFQLWPRCSAAPQTKVSDLLLSKVKKSGTHRSECREMTLDLTPFSSAVACFRIRILWDQTSDIYDLKESLNPPSWSDCESQQLSAV